MTVDMNEYDEEQVHLMNEVCIKVNEKDEIEGPISKKASHLMSNISEGRALHRAFSVFLFNENGEILLQQRSMEKITFPGYWTNTCCSHPLYVQEEMNGVEGVKRAAVRKLKHELGICDISEQDIQFITRILYKAPSDGLWGEHEVDYILFIKKNVPISKNENEVMHTLYVSKAGLQALLEKADQGEVKVTPWFNSVRSELLTWWNGLENLEEFSDNLIHIK